MIKKKKKLFQDGEGERAECFTMCVCLRPPGGLKLTLGKDVQVILGVQTSLGLIRFG